MKTFVIAEMGSCHGGDLERALGMIGIAKLAGADAVKAQYWSSAARLAERRKAPDYEAIYRQYQVPREWLPALAQGAAEHRIELMCTAYLPEDIWQVAPFVQRFKVASFEARNLAFLDAHGEFRKPLIVSTGMMTVFGEYQEVAAIDRTHAQIEALLHCVSAYPCPSEAANLTGMDPLRALARARGPMIKVGYSDHTANVLTGGFAVAAGAEVIEVHFRAWGTSPDNPDYRTALTPESLALYIDGIRQAEIMRGDGVKKPQPAEAEMSKYRVAP